MAHLLRQAGNIMFCSEEGRSTHLMFEKVTESSGVLATISAGFPSVALHGPASPESSPNICVSRLAFHYAIAKRGLVHSMKSLSEFHRLKISTMPLANDWPMPDMPPRRR